MNEELKAIFGDYIDVDGRQVPVTHLRFQGKSDEYVTWTLLSETPALSANDEDLYSVVPLDVDVFSKGNYLAITDKIKELLKQNGWLYTGDSVEMFEEDTQLNHRTCSFEKERYINGKNRL